MADINVRAGDYNDGYKAVFSGGYVFSPSDEWVALASALPGEFVYKLNIDNKENNVSDKNVKVDFETVSLQDKATAAVDAAIEDAFERGAVVGAAENGGYEDGYKDGFAAGAGEADKVQYNRGHSDGYSRGFKDSAEVSDIQINELIKQKEAAYNKGKQEAQRDYMAARESIGNATGELDELRKSVNILYSDIESLYLDAKEGSKAEFALVTILNTFEDAGPLDKAMNA